MASWRDRLLPGSFAGVPFHVLDDETEVGRRLTTTEYPFREAPDVDDFGALAREYPMSAVLVGDDYDLQRDKLLKLAAATGAGDLVHPHYGKMRAKLRTVRASHRVEEGGVCRLALVFVPDTAGDYPVVTVDEAAKLIASAEASREASQAGFLSKYGVLGWPSQVLTAARERVTRYGEMVRSITSPALADAQALAEFGRQSRALVNAADAVIANPLQVAERILNLNKLVRTIYARDALAEFNRLRNAFKDPHPAGTYQTPATAQTVANADALNALIRQASMADAARAAASASYATRAEAEAARDSIAAGLAEDILTAGAELPALLDLRAQVLANIPAPGLVLPDVVPYRVQRTTPALVLAYQLYGDASAEADILARNDLEAPAFVGGGTVIEVLSAIG